MKFYRPTWAEIDLNAVDHNLKAIKRLLKRGTKVLVAVKANAYGHGILEVSKRLIRSGVDYLGVGTTDEAVLLRKAKINAPILILGSVLKSEVEAITKYKIMPTIGDMEFAKYLNRSCASKRTKIRTHVKIDTGMGRIGIWHKEAIDFMRRLVLLKNIDVEGIYTHFPSADEDELMTKQQIRDFSLLLEEIEELGISMKFRHMANSTALLDYKQSHMNLVRPGLLIYGISPSDRFSNGKIKLKRALKLKSKIVFLKDVGPGRKISYGGTHITSSHTKIATIPIGYGDGLSRRLSNKGHILVKGVRAPILGRVCMDQIMADVGSVPDVKVGDEIVLVGRQRAGEISVEEIAKLCDTIPYEITCALDSRIPRVYVR
ncbi:alanine racemase [Candidatus Omnitrophota bacterium]